MTTSASTRVTAAMRMFDIAADGYRQVFARSPFAPMLSRPNPVRRTGYDIPVTVTRVRKQAPDVVSFELTPDSGNPVPFWRPGAHLDVFLPSGKQRSYSLCGDPEDRSHFRIAVRRISAEAGGEGGSVEMHSLSEGDRITVRGPRNAFPFRQTENYFFIAGGIGITPILPMVRHAEREGANWKLAYLGRSRDTLPFLDELAEIDAGRGRVEVRSDDELGPPYIPEVLAGADAASAVYMCGPPSLMDTARMVLPDVDPAATLHTERFSPPEVVGGKPFTLLIAGSSEKVQVAANETTLDAIRRVEPGVSYSCRQGFCSSCMTRVISGEVDHRDHRLTDSERSEYMLTCVSRAAGSTLTVDLNNEGRLLP